MDLQKKWAKIKSMGPVIALQKLAGYEAVFTCACRKRGEKALWEEGGTKEPFDAMEKRKGFWYADPLVTEYEGKTVLFMEAFEKKTGLGRIACAPVEDGRIGTPKVIIEEPFHLSFPMIFEWNKSLYMMPETSTAQKQMLYRCVRFPDQWEETAQLLEGRRLVDPVVTGQNEEEISFLGSECSRENDFLSRFVAFSLYQQDGQICARLNEAYNQSQEFAWDSRNAGYPLTDGKSRIIPLQRSTEAIYGYSLGFWRGTGDELPDTQKIYREILPSAVSLRQRGFGRVIGIHTYSSTRDYEIIDAQYMEFNGRKWIDRWKKRR